MTFPHCNFEAHLVLGGRNRLKSSRSGLIDVCRARCGCRRTVTGRGGTVTYESAAVELDGTHRMIHESWPQGVLADYFLPLPISWNGHVGSELVSVVAGCYISELEMEMAIITFLLLRKKISVIRYAESSNTPNKSNIIRLQDFCLHANFCQLIRKTAIQMQATHEKHQWQSNV